AFVAVLLSWDRNTILEFAVEPYSLLMFMRRSDDGRFFHPAAERVRVEAQDLRRAAWPVNDPTGLLEGGQNMVSRAGFQAFQRRSRSSACCRLPLTFGTGRRWRTGR